MSREKIFFRWETWRSSRSLLIPQSQALFWPSLQSFSPHKELLDDSAEIFFLGCRWNLIKALIWGFSTARGKRCGFIYLLLPICRNANVWVDFPFRRKLSGGWALKLSVDYRRLLYGRWFCFVLIGSIASLAAVFVNSIDELKMSAVLRSGTNVEIIRKRNPTSGVEHSILRSLNIRINFVFLSLSNRFRAYWCEPMH